MNFDAFITSRDPKWKKVKVRVYELIHIFSFFVFHFKMKWLLYSIHREQNTYIYIIMIHSNKMCFINCSCCCIIKKYLYWHYREPKLSTAAIHCLILNFTEPTSHMFIYERLPHVHVRNINITRKLNQINFSWNQHLTIK